MGRVASEIEIDRTDFRFSLFVEFLPILVKFRMGKRLYLGDLLGIELVVGDVVRLSNFIPLLSGDAFLIGDRVEAILINSSDATTVVFLIWLEMFEVSDIDMERSICTGVVLVFR